MLIYFHKNKLRYEKGQLAPFFILILVALIMMAMVTVNLGKVAFVKTDSSNAVDSGALAAGSVMANVFNAVAQANSQLEVLYQNFFPAISISFVLALSYLTEANAAAFAAEGFATSAVGDACGDACGAAVLASAAAASVGTALTELGMFITITWGIVVSVSAFSAAQLLFYRNIRNMAEKGRESAITLGHRFAFINSGIGSKLREGSSSTGITDDDQKRNFRNEFSRFLDNLGSNAEYTYPWEDGEEREHYVRVNVGIDPVNTFKLKVAISPLPAELELLGGAPNEVLFFNGSLPLAYSAQMSLDTALASYTAALGLLETACGLQGCCFTYPHACCGAYYANCGAAADALVEVGIPTNSAALPTMTSILPLMVVALAGLLPSPIIIIDSDGVIAAPFIICWIEDIEHDRKVRVGTTQHHEGADLGLWQTKYPDTSSYSRVDFRGLGQIHPPVLKHDPSIEDTDRIGSGAPSIEEE